MLHTLTLNIGTKNVGPHGALALAGLKESPALHTLKLSLQFSYMRAS